MARVSMSPLFLLIVAIFAASGAVLSLPGTATRAAVFVFVLAGWMISLCLHELAHALAARRGGDYSVESKGYLQLDPLSYADPVNSFMLPMLIMVLGGIGFPGAAVYIERWRIRSRASLSLVSAAGPAVNLGFLIALALPFLFGMHLGDQRMLLWSALALLAFFQATALLFNLLPIPGFDGYGIVEPYLPAEMRNRLAPLAGISGFIVLLAFMIPNPVTSAFFDFCVELTGWLGIDPRYIGGGFRAFRFWR